MEPPSKRQKCLDTSQEASDDAIFDFKPPPEGKPLSETSKPQKSSGGNPIKSLDSKWKGPKYDVISVVVKGETQEAELVVMANAKLFVIRIHVDHLATSKARKDEFIALLGALQEQNPDYIEAIEIFHKWALTPCISCFEDARPPPPALNNVVDFLQPEAAIFNIRAVKDKMLPIGLSLHEYDSPLYYGVRIPKKVASSWPVYDVGAVELSPPARDRYWTPDIVKLRGHALPLFFKPLRRKYGNSSEKVQRELETYKKITAANFPGAVRVPHLHGIVNGRNWDYGLLLSYIKCKGRRLTTDIPASHDQKQKWAGQIKATLEMLHKADIIWGSAGPANILIDVNDDAWIVDFQGGLKDESSLVKSGKVVIYREKVIEWSKTGDLEGLAEIVRYLGLDESIESAEDK